MNYRLPNPIGEKYLENFDRTFKSVHYAYLLHLKDTAVPLCGSDGKHILTRDENKVTCDNCKNHLENNI